MRPHAVVELLSVREIIRLSLRSYPVRTWMIFGIAVSNLKATRERGRARRLCTITITIIIIIIIIILAERYEFFVKVSRKIRFFLGTSSRIVKCPQYSSAYSRS